MTFRSGLRFQTGLSSLRVPCKRALTNVQFFLPEHVFPATKLAWQNGPGIRFTEQ